MSMSHKASNLALHNRVCSIPEGGILFHFDNGLHGIDSAGNIIYPKEGAVATLRPNEGRFSGAVAVEEGTTNLVPSNRLKFEGWTVYGGAQVTRTQNVEFPEIGRNDATRIRTTGGTNTLKYYTSIGRSIADQAYTGSVYIKNIGSKPVRFYTQFGPIVTVNPREWTRAIASGVGNGTSQFQLRFQALNADDNLDFIAWGPQAEHKPFATSFVDGTRKDGVLALDKNIFQLPITISVWAKVGTTAKGSTVFCYANSNDGSNIKLYPHKNEINFGMQSSSDIRHQIIVEPEFWDKWHLYTAIYSDSGARFFIDGELKHIMTNTPTTDRKNFVFGREPGGGNLSSILLDKLLILPYAATDEEIKAWYHSNAPMHNNADTYITL
jgi:hypothetical protein